MRSPLLVAGARWAYWVALWAVGCFASLLAALPAHADSISDSLASYGTFSAVVEGSELRIYGSAAPAGAVYFCVTTVTVPPVSSPDPSGCNGIGAHVPVPGDVYGWALEEPDWSNPTCDESGCTYPTYQRTSIVVAAFGPASAASGSASSPTCGGGDCLSEATFEGWATTVAAGMLVVVWSLGLAHGRVSS